MKALRDTNLPAVAVCGSLLALTSASGLVGSLVTPPAGAAQVPSVAATTAEQGWPHSITATERRDLTRSVARDLSAWIGVSPARGGCHWTACTFRWSAGARHRVALRVYEDGSYRVLAVLG